MTSYERVRRTLDHQPVDRVPYDIQAEDIVWQRLQDHLGLESRDAVREHFGIDRWSVGPRYIGPPLKTFEDGSHEIIVSGGPVCKEFMTPTGPTENTVRWPWADVTDVSDLEGRWGWNGKKEWWDFSHIEENIDAINETGPKWITAHGDPSGLQHLSMWVGDEAFLMMLLTDEDLAVAMIEKHNEIRLWHALKTLEAGHGKIHELNGGGDYGYQNGPLIPVDMFRRFFKDLYVNFYREIKKNFDVEIFFHSCGGIEPLIPELIEAGVTILDPIQSGAAGMDPRTLKKKYGHQLAFHGGIDIQQFLPHATPEEVRAKRREMIEILGENGGFILSPSHNLQPDTPVENILAIYQS